MNNSVCFSSFGGSQDNSIFLGRLPASIGESLANQCEQRELFKNDYRLSKNLINVDVTDWDIHNQEWALEYCKPLFDLIFAGLTRYVNKERNLRFSCFESWVAKYSEQSKIVPHKHNFGFGEWSFCWYLKTPESGTTLTFIPPGSDSVCKTFLPGDVAVFSGDTVHFSDNLSDERVIMSGNFLTTVEMR